MEKPLAHMRSMAGDGHHFYRTMLNSRSMRDGGIMSAGKFTSRLTIDLAGPKPDYAPWDPARAKSLSYKDPGTSIIFYVESARHQQPARDIRH